MNAQMDGWIDKALSACGSYSYSEVPASLGSQDRGAKTGELPAASLGHGALGLP